MIKAKHVFFWTSNSKGHGFRGDKTTILLDLGILLILCCLENFIFLKSVQYIKIYGHLNVWCWKRWIQIFSTEKTL